MHEEIIDIINRISGFDWDEGNIYKNWERHQVSQIECEEIFFNDPLILKEAYSQLQGEKRYFALGKTDLKRLLFIVFTVRNNKIRVISARDMSKKERRAYS